MNIIRRLVSDVVPIAEIKRMRRHFEELLHQRDMAINKLKEENALLLKSSLHQTDKRLDAEKRAAEIGAENGLLKKRIEKHK